MKLSQFELRRFILRKMVRRQLWGGKHSAFDNIPKGFPKEQWKDIKIELKNLIKEGFIIEKHTCYGLHVSLNVKFKAEIEKIIF
ncbi:MAG: hypothetical protein ABIA76_01020 [Candidatus Diapherotrites archaeon]